MMVKSIKNFKAFHGVLFPVNMVKRRVLILIQVGYTNYKIIVNTKNNTRYLRTDFNY